MQGSQAVPVALLGAGARGDVNLATLVKRHPESIRIVAVADAHPGRLQTFADRFNVPQEKRFSDWQDLVSGPPVADAMINALPCRMHYESALSSLRKGYHVLLEKPMALTPRQCLDLVETAEGNDRVLMVSLQSRYNKIYQLMASHLREGRLGRLMNIDCAENVGYWHFILSYVRGIHHTSSNSHSFVMAKGVHDIDLISWFAGALAKRVSSFGSLSFFHRGNAPAGAPERCTDGCPVEPQCPYSALKQYIKPGQPKLPLSLLTGMSFRCAVDCLREPRFRTLAAVMTHDLSQDARIEALQEGPHGRCVFRNDNDVVDHQTVSIEYENDVTASFSLNAFSLLWERTLNLHGTKGEVRSADFTGKLEWRTYQPARVKRKRIPYHGIIHGGGDETLVLAFAEAVRQGGPPQGFLGGRDCLESHLICFAAEEARKTGKVVDMEAFRSKTLRKE